MKLVRPSKYFEQSYISYIQELGDEERYPFTLDLDYSNFSQLLNKLNDYAVGVNLPDNTVANTTFWLVKDSEILGVTNIRHKLSDRLKNCGGHIGLSIRPSLRGKGLGCKLMALSLELLQKNGTRLIHIHCYKSNTSSAKTIISNGGLLDSEIRVGDEIIQRFLIER